MTLQVSPIFNKNIKNLKSSVQKVTDIFATEKKYKVKTSSKSDKIVTS